MAGTSLLKIHNGSYITLSLTLHSHSLFSLPACSPASLCTSRKPLTPPHTSTSLPPREALGKQAVEGRRRRDFLPLCTPLTSLPALPHSSPLPPLLSSLCCKTLFLLFYGCTSPCLASYASPLGTTNLSNIYVARSSPLSTEAAWHKPCKLSQNDGSIVMYICNSNGHVMCNNINNNIK